MKSTKSGYTVIVVTHNSQKHIHKCIAAIDSQTTRPDRIVISDSGSKDLAYLNDYRLRSDVIVISDDSDIGFCRGNNAAMPHVHPNSVYVLFLNPDAFLKPRFCEDAVQVLSKPANQTVGMLSGVLLGYDIDQDAPTGLYDSTGICRTWYGRWYDRDKGTPVVEDKYVQQEEVAALCGALMFCRRQALESILLRGSEVWDSVLYMYKDDIDLSLRMQSKGWRLLFVPSLIAYHCRGWQVDRRKMLREYRLMSAKNEVRVNGRYFRPGLPYSLSKYYAVKVLDW